MSIYVQPEDDSEHEHIVTVIKDSQFDSQISFITMIFSFVFDGEQCALSPVFIMYTSMLIPGI